MFGFEQWDSPLSLGIEVGMSLLIVLACFSSYAG